MACNDKSKYQRYVEEVDGSIHHYDVDGEYHVDNVCSAPAHINADGDEFYYLHGKLHRIDGPACVFACGEEHWYRHGQMYRNDGPAMVSMPAEGANSLEWYQYGKSERIDGPAHIAVDDDTIELTWYLRGQKHRFGGPAYLKYHLCDFPEALLAKLYRDYDLTDQDLDSLDDLDHANAIEIRYFSNGELHRNGDMPAVILYNGTEMWYQNGKLHRDPDEDGNCQPAITKPATFGDHQFEAYFKNGERHRTNGPALITNEGDKFWYQYGLRHRLDGPAIESVSGHREWHIDGKYQDRGYQPNIIFPNRQHAWYKTYDNEELSSDVEYDGEESLEHPGTYHLFHREGGPAVLRLNETHNGKPAISYECYRKGKLHNDDGPANVYPDGYQEYFINGELERVDGPAVIDDGDNFYYLGGKRVTADNPELLAAENERLVKRRRTTQ